MEIDQYRPAGGHGGWKGMEDGKQPIQVPIQQQPRRGFRAVVLQALVGRSCISENLTASRGMCGSYFSGTYPLSRTTACPSADESHLNNFIPGLSFASPSRYAAYTRVTQG